jgi:hypothetical protein
MEIPRLNLRRQAFGVSVYDLAYGSNAGFQYHLRVTSIVVGQAQRRVSSEKRLLWCSLTNTLLGSAWSRESETLVLRVAQKATRRASEH